MPIHGVTPLLEEQRGGVAADADEGGVPAESCPA
jgi:hypothetical protein